MASAVHKNIEPKVSAVNANSVCRQLSQNTAEQEFAAPDEFVAEVQWSMAIRKLIAGLEFGDALKLLMNDRDMSVEQMESESGLSVSTVKRLRAGQEASAEQIVAISVALRLPPMVSSDLLRMCGITLEEYRLSDDPDGPLQRRYRASQCLPCSMWMRPTQNCLLKHLKHNTYEAIGPQNGLVASFLEIFSEARAQKVSPKWRQNGTMRRCETV